MERRLRKILVKTTTLVLSIMLLCTFWPAQPLAGMLPDTNQMPVLLAPVYPDAIKDNWTLKMLGTPRGGEKTEIVDGWRRFVSDPGSTNNPGLNTPVFVNEQMTIGETGWVSFTLKPGKDSAKNNFGFFLDYKADSNGGFFVGHNFNEYFYQKYPGSWYSRPGAPTLEAGKEYAVRIEWKNRSMTSFTIDGAELFSKPYSTVADFSDIPATGVFGVKMGGYQGASSEIFIKDFNHSGQTPLETHTVGGVVVDAEGTPVPGAYVKLGAKTASTGSDGSFLLEDITADTYALSFSKDRFAGLTQTLTVTDADVDLGSITLQYEPWAFAPLDGAKGTWLQDPVTNISGDSNPAKTQLANGWRFFEAGSKNGTSASNTSQYPAVFYLDGYSMPAEGFLETTYTSTQSAKNRFGFYLNYTDPGNAFFVGYDKGGWFWERYENATSSWYNGTRIACPEANTEYTIRLEWSNNNLTSATVNGNEMFGEDPVAMATTNAGTKLAVKLSTYGTAEITNASLTNIRYANQPQEAAYKVTGIVKGDDAKPVAGATVKYAGKTTTTNTDGSFNFLGVPAGNYTLAVNADGYMAYTSPQAIADKSITDITVALFPANSAYDTIQTDAMDVVIDTEFPRVISYTLSSGKTIYGQTRKIEKILINDVPIVPTVTYEKIEDGEAAYTLEVKDEANNINAVVDITMYVENTALEFSVTNITNNLNDTAYPIQKIDIPDHSLVSVREGEAGAAYAGSVMSSDTRTSGDTFASLQNTKKDVTKRYMYAFISNNEISAGIWSNSEFGTAGGGSDNNRVAVTSSSNGGLFHSLGLSSSFWYYNRKITTPVQGVSQTYVLPPTDMPTTRVVIAEDSLGNYDGISDWQDAAILYRAIMNNPYKSEEVPELVAYRIAMNFGGQAQNPFLMTLDNVKKVALHLDGLGQSVLLKGYANEGHDSGHPDYYDIGQRIGGADDFNFLLTQSAQYGARMGIHINAGEMYPEADAYSYDMIRYNGNNMHYGWNWIDQGVALNGLYDLGSGQRVERLQKLKNIVGDNMDFIYLDIWGNHTSSATEDAWETRYVAKNITDMGWRMGIEWGWAAEYDSTFQHWAADLGYGDSNAKGINSMISRFLRNHQKDSWVAEHSSYGGAAVAPLLGGYNMMDFEGWMGRNDYQAYIDNIYLNDLSTKFFQHYQVAKVEYGAETTLPYISDKSRGSSKWTPEVRIVLQDENGNVVEIKRGSSNYTANPLAYRTRTVTLNGVEILKGEMPTVDKKGRYPNNDGTESYLLPWNWDVNTGDAVTENNEKLYHWNTLGGTTTWTLQDSWSGLSNVLVYQLTENGKTNESVVPVEGGKVALTALAKTPYVIYRGTAAPANLKMDWGASEAVVDPGFNAGNLDAWTVTGDAQLAVSSNPVLKLTGNANVAQNLRGLTPGQKYALLVGVDNRGADKASVLVSDSSGIIGQNHTAASIAPNYVQANPHSNDTQTEKGVAFGSNFQMMYVFFTATSDTMVLTLQTEGGGSAYFDDVRVVKTAADNITYDEEGNITEFHQDFENVAQGLYPFVIGNVEGTTDNRTHLAEKHAPYTQENWQSNLNPLDAKYTSDVLDGDWSIKTNGLISSGYANGLLYQTIPQNFRFEPGVTYIVSFDYQMGSPDTYRLAVGDGKFNGISTVTSYNLETSLAVSGAAVSNTGTKRMTITIIGAESGQTWFGFYSTGKNGVYPTGRSGDQETFGGFKDFMVDNVSIVRSIVNKSVLAKTIEEASPLLEIDYTAETWAPFAIARAEANDVLTNPLADQETVDAATTKLRGTLDALVVIPTSLNGTITCDGAPVTGAAVSLMFADMEGQTVITDAEGKYTFPLILYRDYDIHIEADGYTPVYRTKLSLTSGTANTKDFALAVKPVPDYINTFDNASNDLLVTLSGSATVHVTADTSTGDNAAEITFPGGGRTAVYDPNAPLFKDGMFEADIIPLTNNVRMGLVVRGQDIGNLLFASSDETAGKYFTEFFATGTSSVYSSTYDGGAFVVDQAIHMKVEIIDKTVKLWVDDALVFTHTYSSSFMPMAAGVVGFHTRSNAMFIVDNLEVTSYDPPAAGTYNITGTITGKGNAPLHNAVIVLKQGSTVIKSATTGLDGTYTLEGIASGTYSIEASATGYRLASITPVTVVDAAVTAQDAQLIHLAPLAEAIAAAELLDENDYTSGWDSLETALASAKNMLASSTATQAEIDAAALSLENAIAALTPKGIDKTTLQALVTSSESKTEAEYTPATWVPFTRALTEAKAVLADVAATQEEVVAAATALQNAVKALVRRANTAALAAAVNIAASAITQEGIYSPDAVVAINAIIVQANELLASPEAAQAAVDAKEAELLSAIATYNKSGLQLLIDAEKAKNSAEYTPSTWANLQAAITNAEAVAATPEATDEEILAAIETLKTASTSLVRVADKSNLAASIGIASSILNNAGQHMPITIANLQAQLDAANAVNNNPEATQAEVDAADSALQAEIAKAELRPSLTGLQAKRDGYAGIDTSIYTDESVAALKKAIENADMALQNPNATQADVNAAIAQLDSAKAGLALKPVASSPTANSTPVASGAKPAAASSKRVYASSSSSVSSSTSSSAPGASSSTASNSASTTSSDSISALPSGSLPQAAGNSSSSSSSTIWLVALGAAGLLTAASAICFIVVKRHKQKRG